MDEDEKLLKRRHRPPVLWEPGREPQISAVPRRLLSGGSQGGHDTQARSSSRDCPPSKLERRPSLQRKSSHDADEKFVQAWRRPGTGSSNPPQEDADPSPGTHEIEVEYAHTWWICYHFFSVGGFLNVVCMMSNHPHAPRVTDAQLVCY